LILISSGKSYFTEKIVINKKNLKKKLSLNCTQKVDINNFMKKIVFVGLLGLIVLIFLQKTDLTSSDLGRHLNNGRVLFDNHDILFKNAYSYTEPDFPFINHHWLYGVIVYSVYKLSGFSGLTIFNIFLVLITFSLVFFISVQKIDDSRRNFFKENKIDAFYLVSFLALPVILLLSQRTEIRPEIFSVLFIVLTYFLLDLEDNNKKKWLSWLLIPLFLFWVNIHIYFFIGLALIGFKVAAILIKTLSEKGKDYIQFFKFLAIFLGSTLISLVNPNTWHGLVYPLNIFRNYGYEIAENKSIFFLEHLTINHNFQIFKFVLILVLISWLIYFIFSYYNNKTGKIAFLNSIKIRFFDILVSLFIIALSLFSSRNIALFGLISLIIISSNISPFLIYIEQTNKVISDLWRRYIFSSFSKINFITSSILFLLIISSFIYVLIDGRQNNYLIRGSFGLGLENNNEASAEFYLENNLKGPIFNNYDIGSALIFWLHDLEKVFVDNRPEAYSASFFNEIYKPMQSEADKWEKYLKSYNFKTIYFTHTDGTPWAGQFLSRILNDKKWSLVYFDQTTIIFINSEKYDKAVVEALSLDNLIIKNKIRTLVKTSNVKTKLNLVSFSQKLGLPDLAMEICREVLFSYPDQARALWYLSVIYSNKEARADLLTSLNYSKRTIEAGLRLPEVYNQRGEVYWKLGDYNKAEEAWILATKIDKKNINALYYLNQVEELKRAGELPTR